MQDCEGAAQCPPIVAGFVSRWLWWSRSFPAGALYHGGSEPDWEDFALIPFFWRTVCTAIFKVKYTSAEYEHHIRGPLLADETLRRWWEQGVVHTDWFQATLPADYNFDAGESPNFLAAYTNTYCDDSGFESLCELPVAGEGWSLGAIATVEQHFVGSEFKKMWPTVPEGYGDVKRATGEGANVPLVWDHEREGMVLGSSPMIRTTDLSLPIPMEFVCDIGGTIPESLADEELAPSNKKQKRIVSRI